MTNKRKNKGIKPYVEIRDERRRKEKEAIRMQLATQVGEFEAIAEKAGVDIHTVYKALNANQSFYSDKVIRAAKDYIKARNEEQGIPQPEIVLS